MFWLVEACFSDREQLARCVAKEIDGERNWETDLESEEEGSELEAVRICITLTIHQEVVCRIIRRIETLE